jgi:hypothetical protein
VTVFLPVALLEPPKSKVPFISITQMLHDVKFGAVVSNRLLNDANIDVCVSVDSFLGRLHTTMY